MRGPCAIALERMAGRRRIWRRNWGGNDSTIYSYLQRRVCDKGSVLDQRER